MVDDQPARLLTYESVLHGLEVDCVGALSASDALNRLLKQEFAAILLDVHMPEMDGFELAQMIREHPRLEKTPIIFVTGIHVSELDRLKGYEVGAIDYISVPVVPEILRSKVAVLVELHQRRRQLVDLNRDLQATAARFAADAAKAAREEAAKLRLAFEHPHQYSVILRAVRDASGAIVDWLYEEANKNALKLLRQSRETLIGRSIGVALGVDASTTGALCGRALTERMPIGCELAFGEQILAVTAYSAESDYVMLSAWDVSQHRAHERALRESELKYRTLIEHAPVGVAHNAVTGEFLYTNRAFCELVGYTAEELSMKTWHEITHPEDVEKDRSLAMKVVRGEISHYTVEKRYLRKDGSHVWVELFGSFVFDDQGRVKQGVAIAVDVTARKESEMKLRDSRETLFVAKTAARLGTFDWDVPSDSLVWDERTHELWGIPPAGPMKVASFFSQVHPDDHASAQRAIDKSFDPKGDQLFSALYRVIHRVDRKVRWVEATGRVTFENDIPLRMVGVVQEVTERVLAQNTLAESEQRFRELANNIDQFAWTMDAEGRALWFNDRWYDYTGTSFEQLRDGAGVTIHPEHTERVRAHFRTCIANGAEWEDTFPLRAKDGSYRWFLSRAIAIRDEAGKIARWFGTNTDVTQLRQLQETLKDNDRRKDEFLAMLAHELRNPVAPIRNASEVLRRVLDGDREKRLVEIIRRQTAQLAHLLDDLLDVARITSGRFELNRERIELQSCIDAAIETVEPLIREKHQRLSVDNTLTRAFVEADKVRISQCISNVLVNATKFTPESGHIGIRVFAANDQAIIEVTDSGPGIPPELQPRIFDLFMKGRHSSGTNGVGLGVGLFVCKTLLGLHGGDIACRSDARGSTFVIRLPLIAGAYESQQIATESPSTERRVLIVDDHVDSADTLALLLRSIGFDSQAVYSGEAALDLLDEYRPEVVVLDIGLPGMSGYEVARALRSRGCTAQLIALSGYGQEQDRARATAAGFDAHLVKPADTDALLRLLTEQ